MERLTWECRLQRQKQSFCGRAELQLHCEFQRMGLLLVDVDCVEFEEEEEEEEVAVDEALWLWQLTRQDVQSATFGGNTWQESH